MSASTTWCSGAFSAVRVMRTLSTGPVTAPLCTSFSISCCDVTPTWRRNLRTDVLKRSSSIAALSLSAVAPPPHPRRCPRRTKKASPEGLARTHVRSRRPLPPGRLADYPARRGRDPRGVVAVAVVPRSADHPVAGRLRADDSAGRHHGGLIVGYARLRHHLARDHALGPVRGIAVDDLLRAHDAARPIRRTLRDHGPRRGDRRLVIIAVVRRGADHPGRRGDRRRVV